MRWSCGWVVALLLALPACAGNADLSSGTGGASGAGAGAGGAASGASGSGTSGGGSAGGMPCYMDVFYRRCSGPECHSDTGAAAGGLVLTTADVAARLIDVPAAHSGVPAGVSCPTNDTEIDTQNPSNSWLLKKIDGDVGDCGTVMPPLGVLNTADRQCLVDWINSL